MAWSEFTRQVAEKQLVKDTSATVTKKQGTMKERHSVKLKGILIIVNSSKSNSQCMCSQAYIILTSVIHMFCHILEEPSHMCLANPEPQQEKMGEN